GRSARLHNRAQRIAIGLRDGGCTFPGCDRPPGWSEIHHPQPWSEGGRTDLTGVMLCPHHHRHIHTNGWRVRHRDGHVEWQQPGDTLWRRNHRWRA
ncbi:HNH endonuclease signature motif containing protein, partial [Aeromicrobium sp. CF4.19]|uniref:HNH endonuclease signature motif containing protein n=1 Tax=Aeromicrobium sp. CF4.19 TaxID=3373082 RepID=UPI003EE503BF